MDLHPIRPVGRIRPGINYWSNWVEIHSFGGHNLNGFTPNLTSLIRPGINYWSNWVEIHSFGGHNLNGFTPNSTS